MMAEKWYCKIGNLQDGPMSAGQLKDLAGEGRLTLQCLVKRGESGRWHLASQVKGLFAERTEGNASAVSMAKPPVMMEAPVLDEDELDDGLDEPEPETDQEEDAKPVVSSKTKRKKNKSGEELLEDFPDNPWIPATAITVGVLAMITSWWLPVVPIVLGIAAMIVALYGVTSRTESSTYFVLSCSGLAIGFVGMAVSGFFSYQTFTAPPKKSAEEEWEEFAPPIQTPDNTAMNPADENGKPSADVAAEKPAPPDKRLRTFQSIRRWKSVGPPHRFSLIRRKGNTETRYKIKMNLMQVWLSNDPLGSPLAQGTQLDPDEDARNDQAAAGPGARRPPVLTGGDEPISIPGLPGGVDPRPHPESPPADKPENGAERKPGVTVELPFGTIGSAKRKVAANARFVFAKISVMNESDENVINYSSWNVEGPEKNHPKVIMVDSEDRVLEVVPASEAAAAGRLRSVSIPPGDSIHDVLVFTAPSGPFSSLRLVLSYTALGGKGNVGFEISGRQLFSQARSGDPKRVSAQSNSFIPGVSSSPPTVDEINRSIEGLGGGDTDQ